MVMMSLSEAAVSDCVERLFDDAASFVAPHPPNARGHEILRSISRSISSKSGGAKASPGRQNGSDLPGGKAVVPTVRKGCRALKT